MTQAQNDCEVLVIGAGPTGLMAALLLQSSGIQVRIVDKAERGAQESRAGVVTTRSLKLYHQPRSGRRTVGPRGDDHAR
jgi:2-polyprenyl-6-methoxyphenol hydroxylase-like FAD-dependent oxidoreductase